MLEVTTITRVKCNVCGYERYTSPEALSEKDGVNADEYVKDQRGG